VLIAALYLGLVFSIAEMLLDPVFVSGGIGVGVWFAIGIAYFAVRGRHRLVLAPEEAFAMTARGGAD
jgi:ethanolamine permease